MDRVERCRAEMCPELSPTVLLSLLHLLLSAVPAQVMVVLEDSQSFKKEPQQGLKFVDVCGMNSLQHSPEAVHLPASDPAVDGKAVGVSLGGFHLNLGREPGVLRKQREALCVELYQNQLSNGDGAGRGETGHLE